MVCDFQTCEALAELTPEATRAYIWSYSLESASSLRLDAVRACFLVFSVSDCRVTPQQFQLEAGLAAYWGKNALVNAGTRSGKTLSMAIPLLINSSEAVTVVVSPLKRPYFAQAEELVRFPVKPPVVNEDSKPSRAHIKVHCIAYLLYYLRRSLRALVIENRRI